MSVSWHLPVMRYGRYLNPPVSVVTSPIMHVQAHGAQVRKANFADEIAHGISLRELSLYRAACYPASVMGCTARLDSVCSGIATSPEEGGSAMTTGPTVRRRRLGTELRKLRESNGYKLEEVAGHLGVAASTLSRIETGKAPTKSAYLNQMLEMYGVVEPAQRQVLVDMAREGHRKGWWAAYEDVLPSGFDIYVGLEAETAAIRGYEISVVPGLLQTPDYASAVLREMFPRHGQEQIDRMVDLRIERQRRFDDDLPLELWAILDEAVIRRPGRGKTVMRAQLEHLLAIGTQPGLTLQILPFSCGAHAGLRGGAFSILEFPNRSDSEVAYVESVAGHI